IIPFPARGEARREDPMMEELEAALRGESRTPQSEAWVALRSDVRALAPPMAPDFERSLRSQIDQWTAGSPPSTSPRPVHSVPESARRRRQPSRRLRAAAVAAGVCAVAAGVVIAAENTGTPRGGPVAAPAVVRAGTPATPTPKATNTPDTGAAGTAGEAAQPATSAASAPATPGRVQELAASITLAPAPADVQATADRVARLAVSDGGFVQSSQVQQQREGTSEATLQLSLPSARLSAALASLGQIAPVRAQSQSLQDITSAYDGARRTLADAVAERAALLRALAGASTQGQIESLRRQLSLAAGAIARARSALAAVSGRATTATVEVTVQGDARSGAEGLTLHRGLHDAGHVLTVAAVVLLVALAVLVPLALLAGALLLGARGWRRFARERALARP
ncbi:MAG TPA: DUF4349 domain-containing protein, partial [Solirubrobacteraceae bacterium]